MLVNISLTYGLRSDPSIPPGVVWASSPHRLWMGISMGEDVEVEAVELGGQGSWLAGLDLEVCVYLANCASAYMLLNDR